LDEVAGDAGGRVEGAAVEAGEEGLGDVVGSSDDGRRGRDLDEAGALAADGVDHARECGAGDGAGVDVGLERRDAAGHGAGNVVEAGTVDEGRGPAHGVGGVRVAGVGLSPSSLAEERDHRATGSELHGPDRDASEPADAGGEGSFFLELCLLVFVVVGCLRRVEVAGAGGDEPAEHFADGRGEGVGLVTVRQWDGRVLGPRARGRAGRREHRGDVLRGGRGRVVAAAPCDDASGLPRELELRDARLEDDFFSLRLSTALLLPRLGRRSLGFLAVLLAVEARPRHREAPPVELRVSEDLIALLAAEVAGGDEVLLGISEEARQSGAPGRAVGFEDRELVGRRHAVGFGLDVQVELPRRDGCHVVNRFRHASSESRCGGFVLRRAKERRCAANCLGSAGPTSRVDHGGAHSGQPGSSALLHTGTGEVVAALRSP
jgi:hypothetical protein